MDPIQIRDVDLLLSNLTSLTSFKPHKRQDATEETFSRLKSYLDEIACIHNQFEKIKEGQELRRTTETIVQKQKELMALSQELLEITAQTAAMQSVRDDFTEAKAFRQSQVMTFLTATLSSILILMILKLL
jgi:hypothetical protein